MIWGHSKQKHPCLSISLPLPFNSVHTYLTLFFGLLDPFLFLRCFWMPLSVAGLCFLDAPLVTLHAIDACTSVFFIRVHHPSFLDFDHFIFRLQMPYGERPTTFSFKVITGSTRWFKKLSNE